MDKRTSTVKKLRKRDAVLYVALIVFVLVAVIITSQIIEHLPSRRPDEPDRTNPGLTGDVNVSGPNGNDNPDNPGGEGNGDIDIGSDVAPDGTISEDIKDVSSIITGKYNNNIKNIVCIGVDKQSLGEGDRYRSGGQSDVVMIFSMDLKNKEYFILSINRDLAAPVENYASSGSSYGIVNEQIALSYAYGDGGRSSGKNVIKSLNWLLGSDMKFLGYVATPIPIVSTLADAVGGVEVTVLDDFTGVDDTLIQGETVNLRGKHAENYVRARKTMKESNTNALRMTRQIQFMEAFMEKAKRTMSANELVDLYSDILGMIMTDMGNSDITMWILNCYDFEFKGVYRIDGVEGERKHNSRCTYCEPEEVAELVQKLYYIQE